MYGHGSEQDQAYISTADFNTAIIKFGSYSGSAEMQQSLLVCSTTRMSYDKQQVYCF